jgi:Uncharacterized protein conserved in cyanobacteria
MALSQKKLYTIKDIYSLPNAQRAELIDRQIYIIWLFLTVSIKNYEKNYVEPDISVICDRHNLNDRGCSGTPSYIIEIASLSSRRMYYNCKNGLYMDAGIHEYWIVGPEKERTTIYRFDEDATPTIASFEQDIPVGIYEDLVINIAEILNIWRLQR